ncbi:MAG: hypothetical protein ABGZ53_10745, partial [Fuerstiella sp.]
MISSVASYGLPRACGSPAIGEVVRGCTTTRQYAHGTEVVVCYAWHPWYGLTVRIERSITKQGLSFLYVFCDQDRSPGLREIPAWMVDRAMCSSMIVAELSVVTCDSLRLLRDLVNYAVPGEVQHTLQNQHPGSRSSRS